jgi:hypothetical protein
MTWGKIVLAFVLMIVILGLFYWFSFNTPSFLGFGEDDKVNSALRIALSATALLIGIVFGSLHRLWRERTDPLNRSAIIAGLQSAELWRSILAAPLVFSGVYAVARSQPDHILAFFFAFQTGFFTDAVLQAKLKQQVADQGANLTPGDQTKT